MENLNDQTKLLKQWENLLPIHLKIFNDLIINIEYKFEHLVNGYGQPEIRTLNIYFVNNIFVLIKRYDQDLGNYLISFINDIVYDGDHIADEFEKIKIFLESVLTGLNLEPTKENMANLIDLILIIGKQSDENFNIDGHQKILKYLGIDNL